MLDLAKKNFTDTMFFSQTEVCGNPWSSKSVNAIFPTVFAHFGSLYHIS